VGPSPPFIELTYALTNIKLNLKCNQGTVMINFDEAPLYGRTEGLKSALTRLGQKKCSNFIVETGTTRGTLGGGPEADGWATPLFGWYCKKFGGEVWTIDIESEAIEQCKSLTQEFSSVTRYFVGESNKVINTIEKHIDLLYLDSANDPNICLQELLAAEKNISSNTIIYIDDTSIFKKRAGGVCKGVLAYDYLYKKGWDITFDNGDQIILEKSASDERNFFQSFMASWKSKRIYKRVIRKGAL
jgi:hypothetical protein